MSTTTLISIVCPLYNKKNYIKETIYSVIKQTAADWELIVVDDGSTDGSYEIALAIAETDSRVKVLKRSVFRSDMRGGNVCRNVGIEHSTGSLVMFLDADDLLMPYCIAQRLEQARHHSDYDLYVFNVAYCKGEEAIPFARQCPSTSELETYKYAIDKRIYFLQRFLKFDLPWHTSGPLWRKLFLQEQGGFNPELQRLQDPELHTRVLLNEKTRIAYLMETTSFDVLHRKDENRIVWGEEEFLEKLTNSSLMFLAYFFPLLSGNYSHLVPLLASCILEVDKTSSTLIREASIKKRAKLVAIRKLYLQEVERLGFFEKKSLAALRSLFWYTNCSKVAYDLKIPNLILRLYRKIL